MNPYFNSVVSGTGVSMGCCVCRCGEGVIIGSVIVEIPVKTHRYFIRRREYCGERALLPGNETTTRSS